MNVSRCYKCVLNLFLRYTYVFNIFTSVFNIFTRCKCLYCIFHTTNTYLNIHMLQINVYWMHLHISKFVFCVLYFSNVIHSHSPHCVYLVWTDATLVYHRNSQTTNVCVMYSRGINVYVLHSHDINVFYVINRWNIYLLMYLNSVYRIIITMSSKRTTIHWT